MKPNLLEAYEKGRRIINTMNEHSFMAARKYVTLFRKMFLDTAKTPKEFSSASFYRNDLLYRFDLKLRKITEK